MNEAIDAAEEFVLQAVEPLESAKAVAAEALKIENLPDYVIQHIRRLMGEIERVTGGVQPWNNQPHQDSIRTEINRVRQSMPAGLSRKPVPERSAASSSLSLRVGSPRICRASALKGGRNCD